ncbi:MAG: asparagine synthetase B family protein [Planctomycetota bacterium]|jgi:asparagine synthase (glutamine-hydrolysing)
MCGILIVAAAGGRPPSVDERTVCRMRDRLTHRGPDGAGLRRAGSALIGHRRLAIVDPLGGDQPWVEPPLARPAEGPLVLAYNGELYEAEELRRSLPGRFRSRCDTEVLARLLQIEGAAGLDRVRGMFAVAAWWPRTGRLLLARDPLGIKPLLWTSVEVDGGVEIIAGSEPAALLDHPAVRVEPDWVTLSSYLSTIRVTLDDRTMYAGIRTLRPGERIEFDLSGAVPRRRHAMDPRLASIWPDRDPESIARVVAGEAAESAEQAATDTMRRIVADSVRRHAAAADVPVGAMLSGGLDSSIICRELRDAGGPVTSWCATGPEEDAGGDGAHAAMMAAAIDADHHRVSVDRERFRERWPWMIQRLGLPLGTPNEVAIHAVAESARDRVGVLLSGEGADELMAGYDATVATIMRECRDAALGGRPRSATSRLLDQISWVPVAVKNRVLTPACHEAAAGDGHLLEHLGLATAAADRSPADPRPLLSALGRMNLAGLLGRLDTATMLASIEGRTPLADVAVAMAAARLPLDMLVREIAPAASAATATDAARPRSTDAAVITGELRTKLVLRRGWRDRLPAAVVDRPKRSFPLPFTDWVGDHLDVFDRSRTARSVFTREAISAVRGDPQGHALAAWPMLNLALWLQRWD